MTVWLFGKRMDGYHCIEEDLIVYLVHTVYPGIFSCCTDITLISLGLSISNDHDVYYFNWFNCISSYTFLKSITWDKIRPRTSPSIVTNPVY